MLAVVLSGCTVYHYADTCTRSQLLMRGPWQPPMVIPPVSREECTQAEWGKK